MQLLNANLHLIKIFNDSIFIFRHVGGSRANVDRGSDEGPATTRVVARARCHCSSQWETSRGTFIVYNNDNNSLLYYQKTQISTSYPGYLRAKELEN